jgi:pimeloyl-ACP methyl ester carboxylesterase
MKIRANDIEIYYERYGEGDPIIFSHGWLDDRTVWNSQIPLAARNHTVVVYDLRGHGQSDKPIGDYSVQALSGDLHSLVQMLKFEKVTLVGFSLGGMASLMFALQHPAKVTKLVLVGTTAKMPMSTYTLYALKYILPYRIFAWIVSRIKIYKPSKEIIEDNISRAMGVPKHVAYKCMEEFTTNYDIRNRLPEIAVPTLVIVGEKDRTNLKASEHLSREIKGSRLRVVSSCGHSVMIEKPEEFGQLVRQFIDEEEN